MSNKDDSTQPPPAYSSVPAYNIPQNAQMWKVPAQQFSFAAPYLGDHVTTIIPPATQSFAFHQKFLEGKPKALGIVMVVVGIIHIGLGTGLLFTPSTTTLFSGLPFWGAVFYIVAGSLLISAEQKPSRCLVQGSLGLNIIISILCVIGLILSIVDISFFYCYYDGYHGHYYCYDNNAGNVIRAFFILTYLLLFSVSVTNSVFGCRSVRQTPPPAISQVFVVQNPVAAQQPPVFSGYYPTYPQQPTVQQAYMVQRGPTA
ncbi:membrane-spanning 4-domains subfamily A member 8-like [Gastrophryne carolinensis]